MDNNIKLSTRSISRAFVDNNQDYALKLIHIEKSSLDTIRTLHQTIKTLRTALYKSKSELSLLKIKVNDEKTYSNTIEILALENHILKDKVLNTTFGKDVENQLNSDMSGEVKTNETGKGSDNGENESEQTSHVEPVDVGADESKEKTTQMNMEDKAKSREEGDQGNVSKIEESNVEDSDAQDDKLLQEESLAEEEENSEFTLHESQDCSESGTDVEHDKFGEQSETKNLESEDSEEVDEVEFIFTTDDMVKLDQDHLVKIEETDSYPVKPTITHSVFVETDISKCGVLEEDTDVSPKSSLVSNIRRNTSPNPLTYRPYLHKEGLSSNRSVFGHRHSVKFAKDLNIRPIYDENSSSERQDGETQTEISAIPVYWKSESYLNHSKIFPNFTTLPSKFSIPNEQTLKKFPSRKHSLRLCEKTQEARRVLLSDINFTSMVPELSRSVDHLCQEVPPNSCELFKNYPGAFSYMKNPDMTCYSETPCDCSSRQISWEYSTFSIPSTPSAIDITEPKKRPMLIRPSSSSLDTNWQNKLKRNWTSTSNISPTLYRRSKSVPFNSNLQTFSEFSTSQYSGLNTPQSSSSRCFQKHKRMHRKHVGFSGSVPDLRSSVDTEESTDSLIDESEDYLRRSIDSMFIEGSDVPLRTSGARHRRNSAPADAIHGFIKSSGSFYPFTPKVASDLKPNNFIKIITPHGRVVCGRVKYVGPLPGQEDVYVGVQLNQDDGNCDGSYQGKRFFDCEINKGIFVPFKKVVLAWTSG